MEGYGEAWIDLSRLPKLFSKAFLGFKVAVSWMRAVLWGSNRETSRAALLGEERAVLQMLESPKDTRATSRG